MEKIQFRKLTMDDRQLIELYFKKYPGRSCEKTFANAYLWARHYNVTFAVIHNALVFCSGKEEEAFSYPLGEACDVKAALDWILEYTKENKKSFQLYNVTKCQWEQLNQWYEDRFEIEFHRDIADYVYEREKLATLSGKKLHSKRNHINRFKEMNPGWSYESMSDDNLEECFQMALKWRQENGCDEDCGKIAEMCVTLNSLRLFKELELTGGVLRIDGEIVAFTIGEAVTNDTFVVHIEKAYADIQGAYPMINQQFVLNECEAYQYINREDDTGAEGLRKAKLSYRPVFLIEKGTVKEKVQ